MVLEKTLKSPLDCEEIQPVHSKGDQSWVFIGRTNAEAVTPILWPPDVKSLLFEKDPDAGERLWLNHTKTPGFLAPRGEEFNLGPETRLDRSELLCNKYY